MKIRTLLLGSAAVLSMIGTAHAQAGGAGGAATKAPAPGPAPAAGAPGAAPTKAPAGGAAVVAAPAQAVKPVAFVTVCDAFGLGYMYIPGQQATCFRLQGQIQFTINFHTRDTVGPYAGTTSPHEAGWDSVAQGQLTFTAKRMTDHGDLTGVVRLTAQSQNTQNIQLFGPQNEPCVASPTKGISACRVPVDRYVQMDRAFIQYGILEVGYDSSAYGSGTTKQVTFSWDMNGVNAKLGFDDPRDRWGSRLPRYFWMPDVIGAVTGDLPVKGRGNWGFSAGVGDTQILPDTSNASVAAAANGLLPTGVVWGLSGRIQLNTNAIAKGDQLTLSGTVGTGCAFVVNNCGAGTVTTGNTMWQVVAQFRHVFTPTLNTTWQITYTDPNPAATRTNAQAQITWTPLNTGGFSIQNQLTANQTLFNGSPPVLSGNIRFQLQY